MKEYKIELLENGKQIIIYFVDGKELTREHYAGIDGVVVGTIWSGYTEKQNIVSRMAKVITEPVIEKTVEIEGKKYTLVENKLSLWQRFLSIFK